ncbi:hypothetical protein [Pararhizobium sp. DWP1-1-3]
MSPLPLQGLTVLVIEGEYLIADASENALSDAGAEVVGPVASVNDA